MDKNKRLVIEGVADKEFKSLSETLKYLTASVPSISIHLYRAAECAIDYNDQLKKMDGKLDECAKLIRKDEDNG